MPASASKENTGSALLTRGEGRLVSAGAIPVKPCAGLPTVPVPLRSA